MAPDDRVSSPTPGRNTPAGVVGLFGLFAGLCTIFALVATVADRRDEAAQARWPVVSARIEGGEVDPQRVSHGGTTWQLRYKVRFVVEGQERVATLTTRSERSDDESAALHAWAVR